MAYRKQTRSARRPTGRARSVRRSVGRRAPARRSVRRSAPARRSSSPRELRIIVETAPAASVAPQAAEVPTGYAVEKAKGRAKF